MFCDPVFNKSVIQMPKKALNIDDYIIILNNSQLMNTL
jgi:hypothetical protein